MISLKALTILLIVGISCSCSTRFVAAKLPIPPKPDYPKFLKKEIAEIDNYVVVDKDSGAMFDGQGMVVMKRETTFHNINILIRLQAQMIHTLKNIIMDNNERAQ